MKSILIKDTTREEREKIILSSLDCGGGCENCSSCWLGGGSPWEIYSDYIEGKRELAQVINNFSSNEISAEAVKEILSSAIRYTLNFDLLVPNYEDMKIITVNDILQLEEQTNLLRTGKRLGFRFEQDKNE